jgi:fumarate reductase flavoprotein subunit
MSERNYNVIVIGSGAAGLSAAVTASDAGANVLLCEAGDVLGGSSAASGGLFYAAGTSLQRAQGIHDTPDDLFDHYMVINKWEIEPAVARRFADEGADALEWLISLGIEFNPEVLVVAQTKVARGHLPKQFGFGIVQGLSAAISRGTVEVALRTRVEELLTDKNGAVIGIRASGVEVTSDAVVVACGGLENASNEIKREYFPDADQFGDKWHCYMGAETNRGDAISLARSAGAEIVGHNCGLMIHTSTYYNGVEGQMPGWPVFVNSNGRRFISELTDYSVMAYNINRQPGKIFFVIMDHDAFARSAGDPRYRFKPIHSETGGPSFEPEWLAKGLALGEIFKADSIEALAKKAGIDAIRLAATIEEYNQDVAKGHDSHFLKDPRAMVAVKQAPFYAVPRRAAQVSNSSVGLHINADARVYSQTGSYVPGLFAAGEASGGVWNWYVGSGSSIANCVIFGRIAGRSAAAWSAQVNTQMTTLEHTA